MSTVTGASVSTTKPGIDAKSPSMRTGYPTGSSNGGFTYLGTNTDSNGNVWVVLQTTNAMAVTGNTADNAGEVFDPSRTGGNYCMINLGRLASNANWTVRVRTSSDGRGGGVTYSAGTGGGPGGH